MNIEGSSKKLVTTSTKNIKAYDIYLKGRYNLSKGSLDATKTAIQYFEASLRKDKEFVLPLAGLAACYIFLGGSGLMQADEAFLKAKEYAITSNQIDKGLDKTELTLGADVGVAAGPVSKGASAATNFKFDSEIYSYSRSKGLFAGVSVKGGVLSYNESVNESLYGMADISTDDIFHEIASPYNDRVFDLIEVIDIYGN